MYDKMRDLKPKPKCCKQCNIQQTTENSNTQNKGRYFQPLCRECQKTKSKQYHRDNPNYMREWREKNPHKSKEYRDTTSHKLYQKQYREKNRERIDENTKLWRENNTERWYEINKQWRENNPHKLIEYRKTDKLKNPHKYTYEYQKSKYYTPSVYIIKSFFKNTPHWVVYTTFRYTHFHFPPQQSYRITYTPHHYYD